MKLKERLAQKYCAGLAHKYGILTSSDIEKAYQDGFNRCKVLYVDYARRFLSAEQLRDFELIGEKPEYPDDKGN